MKLTIKLFGILLLLLGLLLLIKPGILLEWMENNNESTLLYISAIFVRLFFGILFLVSAGASKYPRLIRFLGSLFVLAAFIFIYIGEENFQAFISSLLPNVKPYAPFAGLLSIVFGVFIVYAFSIKPELEQK